MTLLKAMTVIGLATALTGATGADALADTGADAGPAVAHGSLVTTAGKPASSVPVTLLAWPGNDVTDKQGVGKTVGLRTVSRAVTGPDGSFDLRAPSDFDFAALAGDDAVVNFTVVAGGGSSIAPFSFPRRVRQVAGRTALTGLVAPPAGRSAAADPVPELRLTLDRADAQEARAAAEPTACQTTLEQDFGPRWTIVGAHYSRAHSVAVSFSYQSGSSSELGVGVSKSGTFGTFEAKGTSGKSSSVTIGYPVAGHYAKQARRTQYRYGKYKIWCIGGPGASFLWYETRAINFVGGAYTADGTWTPPANYCAHYQPRSFHTQDSTKAYTFSGGVDVTGVIGINLSAETGYSNTTSLTYAIGANPRRLCGMSGYPGDNGPQLIVATWG